MPSPLNTFNQADEQILVSTESYRPKNKALSNIGFYSIVVFLCFIVSTFTTPFVKLKSVLLQPKLRLSNLYKYGLNFGPSEPLVEEARIALCIAGNARTFFVPRVHETIIKNVVEPLQSQYPTDIFVLVKASDNPRPGFNEVPTYVNETLEAIAKLSPTVLTLLNSSHDYNTTRMTDKSFRNIKAPEYCKEKSHVTAMFPYTLLRSAQCLSAIEAHERKRGKTYRWIYRARPDVVPMDPIISPNNISTGVVYTSAGPWDSVRGFVDWWQEKQEPFRNIPSFGDHFLAGRRREAGIGMRALEAIETCELYGLNRVINSESALGLWILSHGLDIKSQLWPWSVIRAVDGPDCDRMRQTAVSDPVVHEIVIKKCERFRTDFMKTYGKADFMKKITNSTSPRKAKGL